MYILTRQFWRDFRNDPKIVIDNLRDRKSRFWYPLFRAIIFWRVVVSEYLMNHCITRSSAIAFAMLLTLIPLIATVAIMFTSIMDIKPLQIEHTLSMFLPFAPPTILNYITTFFTNAQKLRGMGIGVLIIMTVGLFGTVEESLNTIWKVTQTRSFFVRLRTFTMVMVYSPILFFASFQVRRSLWLGSLPEYLFLFDILPFIFIVLAFTTMIWFVPNTKVKFSSALLGGLIAGVLFELERQGYGTYVRLSIQTQTIYGAFGILPLFLVSLFVGSLFILFGAQVAYVHQNFRPLLRAKRRWDRRVGDYKTYITFRMLIDTITSFMKKKRPPTIDYFTNKYELTEAQANGILNWLIHANFVHKVTGKESFVPTGDFSSIRVKDIYDSIEDQNRQIPSTPTDYTRTYMELLMSKIKATSGEDIAELTFEHLVRELDNGEKRAERVAATLL